MNIAAHLTAMAQQQPWRPAVVFPEGRDSQGRVSYTHYTYRQLDAASDQLAHGFQRLGLRRGMNTALMVPPSLDFFALTFALFKLGAVPVLIDPGIGVRNLGKGLSEAAPEAFIGIPKAQAARLVLGWAGESIAIKVTVGRHAWLGGHTLGQVRELGAGQGLFPVGTPARDETAAILFTSGSTGPSKGVVYTHEFFGQQVEQIRQLYGIQPGEIDLPTFPLFALFGPALGMTAILPDMDPTRPAEVDPVKIVEAIESFGVTNMFGSPAVINRVGRYGETHGVKLPTLRRVISAGAPVPAKVIQRFAAMLSPGAQVFTPYGATECLPVSSIGSDELLTDTRHQTDEGKGVCVGRPVPGLTVKVIRISDEVIPAWSESLELSYGQVGEIAVKGPHVTRTYFNRPEATALAKIPAAAESAPIPCRSRGNEAQTSSTPEPPHVGSYNEGSGSVSGGFYHRMGDVGYLDERGRIWFCGRKSHRVVTRDGTLFTIPCEAVFNTHPAVFRTALVGVWRGGEVEPVVCVELEPDQRGTSQEKVLAELTAIAAKFPHTQAIKTFLFHPAFPVDIRHNAKIFREKLAVWAGRRCQ
jgi:acyl-CoA synthetase (AMP-forming)/AMP-acid ligase II